MNELYIDIREWNRWFKDRFPNKDFVSLEDILGDYENCIFEIEHLEEEIKDIRQDIEDNYKPIEYKDQYEVYDRDFI